MAKKNEKTNWIAQLRERKANCYIKPLRGKHESGFRVFEVGYCSVKDARVAEKKVLGTYSDHIHTDYMGLVDPTRAILSINMDLTLDGYIRFWGSEKDAPLWWGGDYASSSAELSLMP